MKKPTLKPLYTILMMFTGMLIGLVVLVHKSDVPGASLQETLNELMPDTSVPEGLSIQELFITLKTKKRISTLMHKDSLSAQDSLEIKAIDHHLNQLLDD